MIRDTSDVAAAIDTFAGQVSFLKSGIDVTISRQFPRPNFRPAELT
jgi:hypothetical protein